MKIGKILAIAIVFILLIPSISSVASSKGGSSSGDSNESLSHKLLRLRFNFGSMLPGIPVLGRYFILQQIPPTPIQAFPPSVSLTYLNQTTFIIGGKNPKNTSQWQSMVGVAMGWSWGWMDREIIFHFEFVPPSNTSEDIWNVEFNPEYLYLYPNRNNLNWFGAETPFKTNVKITLKPNINPSIVTKDTILMVNINKTEVMDKIGILKGSPRYTSKYNAEYVQKAKEIGEPNIYFETPFKRFLFNHFTKWSIFLMNSQNPSVQSGIDSTVQILIKVNKFHLAEVTAPPPMSIQPYDVKSIPISIKNVGSHTDSYNFRVNCSDNSIIVTPPPALTLKPGEEVQALVGVAAPKTFMAVGSTASIHVEAYSVDDPTATFSNTITLTMTGVYASGADIYLSIIIVIILLVAAFLFLYFFKRFRGKIGKIKKETIKKTKVLKEETLETVEIKKEEKQELEKKEVAPSTVDTDKERERLRKEKAILKTIKEQEKQKRKLA